MASFVTGGTGLIGRFLVDNLIERDETVYLLVRRQSSQKFQELYENRWNESELINPIYGDITDDDVLEDTDQITDGAESIQHVYHLAAVYELDIDLDTAKAINVDGTRNVVNLRNQHFPDAEFHHVSSIAVAGDYDGLFREDYFDEGQSFENPYFKTKYDAERVVRGELEGGYSIYRPGVVVGSSEDGEIDKINGPYYFFKLIQQIRDFLPRWVPLVGLEGNEIQLAPVDYVADALDHISHASDDRDVYHLVDPNPRSLGDTANAFFKAAKAPELSMRIDSSLFDLLPINLLKQIGSLPMVEEVLERLADNFGIPLSVVRQSQFEASFDDRNTKEALEDTDIECPPIEEYAWKLWDYWERHLDPDLHRAENFREIVEDQVVTVTGASSGIGRKVALRVGKSGGNVMLLARSEDDLKEVKQEIEDDGEGNGYVYPCDLTDYEQVDEVVHSIVEEHGPVDILINNAGHSIRRSIFESLDRFHDFKRTMQLNYFGALRMILRSLPGMVDQQSGHIINVSSVGVLSNAPRFSAYVASKSALDAFSRCIAAEVMDSGIDITTVYMPLVRTPMIEPTKIYQFFPALTPDEAADLIEKAIVNRPKRIATRLGTFAEVMYAISPKLCDAVLNLGYRIFPSNQPSDEEPEEALSPEGVAFAHLLKGIHW